MIFCHRMLQMPRHLSRRCSVTLSVSSLRTRVSTRWTLKKHQWWGTEMTSEHSCLQEAALSPRLVFAALFHFHLNNELAIMLRDTGLIPPLISRGDIHHSVISKLLAAYWSSVTVPSPADVRCVVSTVDWVQPSAALPALPASLLPPAASPLRRHPHRLPGMFPRESYLLELPHPCVLAAGMINISASL